MLWPLNPTDAGLAVGRGTAIAISRKPASTGFGRSATVSTTWDATLPAYWDREQVIATYMAFIAGPEDPGARRRVAQILPRPADPDGRAQYVGLENFPASRIIATIRAFLSNLLIRDRFELPDIRSTPHHHQTFPGHAARLRGRAGPGAVARRRGTAAGLVRVLNKPWRQSSPSTWSPVQGVMPPQEAGGDFFFHTETEENPWWSSIWRRPIA